METVKEKIIEARDKVSHLEGAYKDDPGSGEYQDARKARKLLDSVLRIIG